jgi:NAD(P)-dependent dehydrogenase (short-subunit alcohol dehydrogenase family)
MSDPSRHTGKSVLVTGGASGIGPGIVERFLAEGARVASLGLRPTPGAGVLSLTGNAADEAEMDGAVAETVAAFGGLDVMVNNAGVIAVTPVTGMGLAEWRRVMAVNVDSVFLGSRAAARQMIRRGRGAVIVSAASGAGRRGVPNLSHYCASRAAVIVFSQALAIELAPHGIRVNTCVPGHIETPFWHGIADGFAARWGGSPEEVVERFRATVPAGRFGTPGDAAAAVSWLATDEAACVSGQGIAMNGAEFPW